jgi:pre-rRNA-processing protein IPI3
MSSLLDVDKQNEVPTPWTSLSDHTLPVTDIAVGLGTFPRLRIFTSSADHTVKVWDLATKALLSTFHLPSPLSHIVVDPSERAFFASSALSTGEIYQVNLFAPCASNEADPDAPLIALGGHGRGDVIRIDAGGKRLFAPGQAVSALALSLTGTTLLAGTTAGKVLLFDVASHQLLRSFVLGAPVTYLASGLRPPDLAGHVRLGGGRDARAPVPRHVAPLQRTRDEKARLAHEAWVRLPEASVELDEIEYDDDELAADLSFFTRPAETRAGSGVGGAERVHELEEEVAKLRAELGKAKGLNDKMWDAVVTTVMKEAAPATTQVETEDHGRAKKKRK